MYCCFSLAKIFAPKNKTDLELEKQLSRQAFRLKPDKSFELRITYHLLPSGIIKFFKGWENLKEYLDSYSLLWFWADSRRYRATSWCPPSEISSQPWLLSRETQRNLPKLLSLRGDQRDSTWPSFRNSTTSIFAQRKIPSAPDQSLK